MNAALLADVALAAALVAIAIVDVRTYRIPDRLSLPLVAAGLAWAYGQGADPWTDHLLGALLGYASLAAVGALYHRWRRREGLGLGDAKLFAAAGALLGWRALPLVLVIASLGGLAFALLSSRGVGERPLAFGPWLALGIWIVWLSRR